MKIFEIISNKKKYINLLLMADEQENMIDRYLENGTMYLLDDNGIKAVCVVTDEVNSVLEIKNIAVVPECRKKGYGRKMIEFIEEKYSDSYDTLKVGTDDSPLTVPFYEKCGFRKSYTVKNFFTENYNHPIFECGVLLTDMIYLEKSLD
ncbi:MAG: GNAT family N-acetyltransferase [Ruminococcus flavefaciens]|nr:GNAT family N-acetyltransferase [Ruminococcus flavefaciens]